jgi:predicted nucleic acid-binding Zn ribbon protein
MLITPQRMSGNEKSRQKLTTSSEVLHALFENGKSALSLQFLRWKMWKMWSEYAGTTIAANTEPVGYRQGVLYLWVKSASWMQQLVFMREPLAQKINEKLGFKYVYEIRLTLDRRSVPQDALESEELRQQIANIEGDGKV